MSEETKSRKPYIDKNAGTSRVFLSTSRHEPGIMMEMPSEDEAPIRRETPPHRFSLTNLLDEARRGGKEDDSPKHVAKDKKAQDMIVGSHAHDPPELPSLQALQHAASVLMSDTASTYRPIYADGYDPRKPHLWPHIDYESPFIADIAQLAQPANFSNRYKNSSQVSLCTHKHLYIEWDPLDPENRQGSWRPGHKYYWDDEDSQDNHKSCKRLDQLGYRARGKVLAQRIIDKFNDMEEGRLTHRERNNCNVRRPPRFKRVNIEVQTLIAHMRRGRNEKLAEKKHAASRTLLIKERHQKQINRKRQQTQQDRQQASEAKSRVHALQHSKNMLITAWKHGDNRTERRVPHELTSEFRRGMQEPKDRYRMTTIHERDEHMERIRAQVSRDWATLRAIRTKEAQKTSVSSRDKAPRKSHRAAPIEDIESDAETEGRPARVRTQAVHRPIVIEQDSDDELVEEAVLETQSSGSPLPDTLNGQMLGEASKPTFRPLGMTAEERALLEGIKQAEEDDVLQQDEAENEAKIDKELDLDLPAAEDEEEELRNELVPSKISGVPLQNWRHVSDETASSSTRKTVVEKEDNDVIEGWDALDAALVLDQGERSVEERNGEQHEDEADNDPSIPANELATKKRKLPTIGEHDEEPVNKRNRKTHKSARIVEDSDDDANCGLQEESLIDKVVQHQEDITQQGQGIFESTEVVGVDETVQVVGSRGSIQPSAKPPTGGGEQSNETAHIMDTIKTKPASPGSVRKISKPRPTMEVDVNVERQGANLFQVPKVSDEEDVDFPTPMTELTQSEDDQILTTSLPSQHAVVNSTSPVSPISGTTTTWKKRKRSTSEDSLSSIKKAKKTDFLAEATSPPETPRRTSIPSMVGLLGDEEIISDAAFSQGVQQVDQEHHDDDQSRSNGAALTDDRVEVEDVDEVNDE